jgi:hypothetical protein
LLVDGSGRWARQSLRCWGVDTKTAAVWPGCLSARRNLRLIRGRSLLTRTDLNKVDFDAAIEAGGEVVFDRVASEQDRHVQAEWIAGALSRARQAITIKNAVITTESVRAAAET